MGKIYIVNINKKKNRQTLTFADFFGSPNENRTRDSALRGLRLNRLTMRPYLFYL